MLDTPCCSSNQECLKIRHYKLNHDAEAFESEYTYVVNNDMTIEELRNKWYENNIDKAEDMEVGQERYVLMWDLKFPLYDHYTISYLKKILMI